MNTYWWFRPSNVVLFLAGPICLLSWLADDDFYAGFGTPGNVLRVSHLLLLVLSILSFASASRLGEDLRLRAGSAAGLAGRKLDARQYNGLIYALATCVFLAFALYLSPFGANPDLLHDVLEGAEGAVVDARASVNNISGITSAVNLSGVLIVLLLARSRISLAPPSPLQRAIFVAVFGLMAIKVVAHSERLSLLELCIPAAIVLVGLSRRRRLVLHLLPLFGIALLIVYFAAAEYLRSWVNFYQDRYNSLAEFAVERILGYYATAISNAAVIYDSENSMFFPVMTAGWLWRFPVPGWSDRLAELVGVRFDPDLFVANRLNLEFNNVSGILCPLIDFGPIAGLATWAAIGFVSGRLFRAFREGRFAGLLLFPTWYVGVLEFPRLFYWGDSRYFPTLALSLLLIGAARIAARSRPAEGRLRLVPIPSHAAGR